MSRIKTFFMGTDEDVAEYTHSICTQTLKILVGVGIREDGAFKFLQPQTFEVYEITGQAYENFMLENPSTGKPVNTFRKEDLWELVDNVRNDSVGATKVPSHVESKSSI